jgi:F0F1-type ATP synthase assembly protein I
VSVPALVGIFGGQYLDGRFGTEPWFFLGLTASSFLVSMTALLAGVSREFSRIRREAEGEDKKQS